MKRTRSFLVLPALAIAFAAPLGAQQADPPVKPVTGTSQPEPTGMHAGLMTADALEDASIVTLDAQYDEGIWSERKPFNTINADWDEIGEVEDVVLDETGQVIGLTVDVGGFLGMGEKSVLLPLDDVRVVRTGDDDDDLVVVTRLNAEALEALQEFDLDLDD